MEPKDMCEARRRAADSMRMSVNNDDWLDVAVVNAIRSACGGFKAEAFGEVLAELLDHPTCTMEKTDSYKTESGETVNVWECSNCGHIVIGKKAPEVCPVCKHPRSYFQIKAENY